MKTSLMMRLVFLFKRESHIPYKDHDEQTSIGRKVNVVRIPAARSFLRAYAIQAAIVNAMGKIGYDHTAMTKVQA